MARSHGRSQKSRKARRTYKKPYRQTSKTAETTSQTVFGQQLPVLIKRAQKKALFSDMGVYVLAHLQLLEQSHSGYLLQEMAMTSAIRLKSANPARVTCEYSQRSRNSVQSGGRVSFSSRELFAANEKKPELKRSRFSPSTQNLLTDA
jgi:hypothetical protein